MSFEKKEKGFGVFMLGIAGTSLAAALISEYLFLYDVTMVARYDYSKISNASHLMFWAIFFCIVVSLVCFIVGLKKILPKNRRMYWGIIIFAVSAIFFMIALTIAVLAFFNAHLNHGQEIVLNSLVYTTLFLVLSIGLFFVGLYMIFFLNKKEKEMEEN